MRKGQKEKYSFKGSFSSVTGEDQISRSWKKKKKTVDEKREISLAPLGRAYRRE